MSTNSFIPVTMNRKQALVQLIKHLNTETKTDDDDDDVVQFGVAGSTLIEVRGQTEVG